MHPYNTLNVPQIVKISWGYKDNNNKYLTFNSNFDIGHPLQIKEVCTGGVACSLLKLDGGWQATPSITKFLNLDLVTCDFTTYPSSTLEIHHRMKRMFQYRKIVMAIAQ